MILPAVPGVADYAISTETGTIWSAEQIIAPGATFSAAGTIDAFRFHALDSAGDLLVLTDPVIVGVAFANTGTFTGDIAAQQAASGNVFGWIGGDGDFGDPAHWTATAGTANAPPWSVDEADFLTGGGTVSGLGSAYRMVFDGAAPWTITGTLAAAAEIDIGQTATMDATGTLAAGGTLTSAGSIDIGATTGGAGFVGISDAALSALGSVVLGDGGGGTIAVGAAGTLVTSGGWIVLGQQTGGSGWLMVSSGGSVSAANAGGVALEIGAAGSGDVVVAGTGSAVTAAGAVNMGDSGLGNLTIRSAATVTTTTAATIAAAAGSAGSSANVTGANSLWQIAGALVVGNAASGSLNIASGGTVSAASLDAAAQSTGNGIIAVTGTASSLTLTGSLTLGDQSAGELSILGGATVSAGR